MRLSKKYIITLSVLALLLLLGIVNAFFIWGICVDQDGGFEWAEARPFKEYFPRRHNTMASVGDGLGRTVGIPFVLLFYLLDKPPYDVSFMLDDETQDMKRMIIEHVSIKYNDGRQDDYDVTWEKDFVSVNQYRSVGGERKEIPIRRLEASLSKIINESKTCNVIFEGFFINDNGEKLPFNEEVQFAYEPISWRVYTGLSSF